MTQQNGQSAVANSKVDELAQSGATMEGAEFAEHVDGDADEVKKEVTAATLHCQGEDSVDMEEITEEMKQEPEWRFDVKEKELFLAQDGEGYRLEKSCIKVLGAVKRSIHDTVGHFGQKQKVW